MNQSPKTLSAFAGALLLTLLATSCSSTNSVVAGQIPLHPAGEARISDKPLPGYVATNVWRVKGHSGNVIYLAGTRHVIPARDIPFPSSYYAAYQDSRDVSLEVDEHSLSLKLTTLGAIPSVVRFLVNHGNELDNPEGRKLSDSLSPQTVALLRKHYGSDLSKQEKYTPLGLLVFQGLMADEGPNKSGVDDYFNFVAHRDGKKIRGLDGYSVVDTLKPAFDLTLEESRQAIAAQGADAAVRDSILSKGSGDSNWRYGKFDKIEQASLAKMKKDHPATYQMLLPARNQKWMTSITQALEGKRKTMILVGSLHLPGPDGLLELLRRKGYQPQQMYGIDHPKPKPQA